MQWLASAISKGPAIKADILDAGTELKGSKIQWKVHEGKLKETGLACTVFTWEMTAGSTDNELAAARNALKRLKTTRHPTVLQYIDGVDPEAAKPGSKVIIVTEHVKPLEECLAKEPAASNKEGTAWGLNTIAQSLRFITEECGLIHGNVSRSAIFVSDCGDWKLAGFELLSENTDTNSLLRRCEQLRIKRVLPPEVSKGIWSAVPDAPHAIDMWSFGCLIHEVYNGMLGRPEDLKDTSNFPKDLVPLYQSTLKADPSKRPRGQVVLSHAFFSTQLVMINKEMSNLQLMDGGDKEKFFLKLTECLDSLPDLYLRNKLLPELLKAVEFGGAGTAAIAPMLKIGQRMKADEFSKDIVPGVVRCFKSTDRATRIGLLQVDREYAIWNMNCIWNMECDMLKRRAC
jgi:SCY1-like protein 1